VAKRSTPTSRLAATFDLIEFGEQLMWQNLKRRHRRAGTARARSLWRR